MKTSSSSLPRPFWVFVYFDAEPFRVIATSKKQALALGLAEPVPQIRRYGAECGTHDGVPFWFEAAKPLPSPFACVANS